MYDPLTNLLLAALITALGLFLFWPERGVFWRWQRARQFTERVLSEDALKHIHNFEMEGRRPTVQSVAGALHITVNQAAELLSKLEARNLVQREGEDFQLTPQGRNYALRIIRAHRLWERHLADQAGFEETAWHEQAERYEHWLSLEETDALAVQLGHPAYDPHGDPIPTAEGELPPHGGKPLTALAIDKPARIVHIEDEPEAIYAQLVAEGLHAGMIVRVTEVSSLRVCFWANGDEHILAPIVAANITVVPLPDERRTQETQGEPLSRLKPGEKGKVVSISPACRGTVRRRLMDLGILPGTVIEVEMKSPAGDPTAYRIRGAMIALRKEQARWINIVRL